MLRKQPLLSRPAYGHPESLSCVSNCSQTNLMKIVLAILCLLQVALIYAQRPSDEAVYASIMDTIVKSKEVEFYYPKLQHTDTQEYSENLLDSIIVFNPETYEEVRKSVLDVLIESDNQNLQEAMLFKQRLHFPNGVYVISKITSSQLHKKMVLQDYIDLESYPRFQNLAELSGAILNKNTIGPYATIASTKGNISIYKYAIKAYFAFSGVLWDKTKTYCLVECGCHYLITNEHPDGGPSGGGFQVIMKNENGKPRILKFIGLWEE